MGDLLLDLRYGLRGLRARPGFTAAALVTLTLGIGATTAIFSIVRAVLIEPLPYAAPDRLVMLWHNYSTINLPKATLSVPAYIEYRDHVAGFESVAVGTNWSANLTGSGEPERVQGMRVTADFLRTLGVGVTRGRDFLPEEDRPGGEGVVILTDGLWKRRFGADPGIVGKPIDLNGQAHTVVGILPPGFSFLTPTDLLKPIAFKPEEEAPSNHGFEYLIGLARLRPGVTFAQARSQMDVLVTRLRKEFYDDGWGVTMTPLLEEMTGDVKPALMVLLGAVGCLLLLACANVANLLLARSAARQREIAVRVAIGAGRRRIVTQLLTESALLAIIGGAFGLVLAFWAVRLLAAAAPVQVSQTVLGGRAVGVDLQVLGFTLALSLLTSLLFGLAPALRASRPDLAETLKEGARAEGLGGRGHRLLGGLVVAQVACALVLLVGAGLLGRSFLRLRQVDPGFRADGILTMNLSLPAARYAEDGQVSDFFDRLVPRLGALPGVAQAAAISNLPMGGNYSSGSFQIEGRTVGEHEAGPHGDSHYVAGDYFATMQIPLVRGRTFDAREAGGGGTPAIIIDKVLADRYFANDDPIGHRVAKMGEGTQKEPAWRTIVGVVGHVSKYGLDGRVKEQYYIPAAQRPQRAMTLVLRAAAGGDAPALAASARAAVRAVDPDMPVFRVATMAEVIDATLVNRKFVMLLLGQFAAVALVLAGVGLFGVLSYAVSRRTREIGVRMALGARAADVLGMVVRQGMTLTAIGLVIGAGAALAATRGMAGLLFGVGASDPPTYVALALVLAAVALFACWLPARRAARVDPMVALRAE
jgi:putative ABC transport system permease protein